MLNEFKAFAIRGNLVDMAVGITVGAAFGAIAKSLVTDLLMPPIGLALGGVKFADLFVILKEGATPGPYNTLADAAAAGAVTINYGTFLDNIVAFLVVAFAVFMLVRMIERLRREAPAEAPTVNEKECSFCLSKVPLKAIRCAHCTSDLS